LRRFLTGTTIALLLTGCSGALSTSEPAGVTARLVLRPDRVRPGGTADGRLVLTNGRSKTVVLLRGCRINGLYGIGIRSPHIKIQGPAFTLVGCLRHQTLVAKPGTTVYGFKVAARYTGCTQALKDELPRTSAYWTPLCGKRRDGERNIMPSLPPGTYTTVFVPNGKWKGPAVHSARLVVEHRVK
jgi:hypothetical protein